MKRFYREARAERADGGWRVELDGRAVKTVGGRPQIEPTRALAEAMAEEWRDQGETIDPARFFLRDLADYAIDGIAPDREAAIGELLRFAETDTLSYRADPGEPVGRRQEAVWEPLLQALEARYDVRFTRVSGVIHQPQSAETMARLRLALEAEDAFALAALQTLASLSASLGVALAAIEPGADALALWAAANLEEDWQAEIWGEDAEALARRSAREAAFLAAVRFAALARESAPEG